MNRMTFGLVAIGLTLGSGAAMAASLTDLTVFSSNSDGHNWNGLIWNTQGADTDTPAPGRYNLYVTSDPLEDTSPTFINGFNDSRTRVNLSLVPGEQTYSIYGEGVGRSFDPLQHFVLNLYFDGMQSGPGISGVQSLANSNLVAAGSPNGLDIFGGSGHPGAGTLTTIVGGHVITLTGFSWVTDGRRDTVWDYWANDAPYSNGSGRLDYYGSFTLNVRPVQAPEPGTLALLGLGLAGLGLGRRRKAA